MGEAFLPRKKRKTLKGQLDETALLRIHTDRTNEHKQVKVPPIPVPRNS